MKIRHRLRGIDINSYADVGRIRKLGEVLKLSVSDLQTIGKSRDREWQRLRDVCRSLETDAGLNGNHWPRGDACIQHFHAMRDGYFSVSDPEVRKKLISAELDLRAYFADMGAA